jgi:hypothetical protein
MLRARARGCTSLVKSCLNKNVRADSDHPYTGRTAVALWQPLSRDPRQRAAVEKRIWMRENKAMELISLREFARRNGVSAEAISRAVKAGRLPAVNGRIDPEQAQPVWDRIQDRGQVGRKLVRKGRQPQVSTAVDSPVDTANRQNEAVSPAFTGVNRPVSAVNPAINTPVDAAMPVDGGLIGHDPVGTNGGSRPSSAAGDAAVNPAVDSAVGVNPLWVDTDANGRLPHGLDKRVVRVQLDESEYLELRKLAHDSYLSVNNVIRTRLGFRERNVGKLSEDERDQAMEDAWERLKRLGLNPRDYLPDY